MSDRIMIVNRVIILVFKQNLVVWILGSVQLASFFSVHQQPCSWLIQIVYWQFVWHSCDKRNCSDKKRVEVVYQVDEKKEKKFQFWRGKFPHCILN